MARTEHLCQDCAATRRRGVLVVEDEILVRLTIADHLRGARYEVVEAANATEAIAVFASGELVDIVFTDVQMPGAMDGLMLARWVHEHHPGIHVLVTSGKGDGMSFQSAMPHWRDYSEDEPEPITRQGIARAYVAIGERLLIKAGHDALRRYR